MTTPAYLQRMLTGVSTLMLLDPAGADTHIAFSRRLFGDYVQNTANLNSPQDIESKGNEAEQWFKGAWWFMRDRNAVANTLGSALSLSIAGGGASETFERFLNFGATLSAQGVPMGGALGLPSVQGAMINAVFTGATFGAATTVYTATLETPAWFGNALGWSGPATASAPMSPALIFTIVNLSSKVLCSVFRMEAVSDALGKSTAQVISGPCALVSAACDVITNTITGGVRHVAFNAYEAVTNTYEALGNIMAIAINDSVGLATGSFVANLEANAMQIARSLTTLMWGGADLDAMIAAGVDTARFTVDLLTGNFDNLEDSAKRMGLSFLNTVLSNHYVEITSEQLYKFVLFVGVSGEDALDWYLNFGRSHFAQEYARTMIGIFTGETWNRLDREIDRALGTIGDAFDSAGREIRSWF
jgi:hypothetical protein